MMFYRNSEGYPDPTAGAALTHVYLEEKRRHRAELSRVSNLVIQRCSIDEIATLMQRSPEYIRQLLIELNAMFSRKCREVR